MKSHNFLSSALVLLTVFVIFAFAQISAAQDLATDFDGDGKSDFAAVAIKADSSLSWSAVNPASGAQTMQASLGIAGQHIVLANWLNPAKPLRGVVSANASGNLIWQVIDANGQSLQRTLGTSNNLAISGADFDGNGLADGAIARKVGGKVTWTVAFNMFSRADNAQELRKMSLGTDLSTAFYAAPRPGKDWLGTFIRTTHNKSYLKFRDLKTGKVLQSNAFAINSVRPFPVHQANGSDIIGFAIGRSNQTILEFRSVNGKKLSRVVLPTIGDVIVGDFTTAPGEEVAVKSSSQSNYFVFSPKTKKLAQISGQQGIAVDAININTVTAVVVTPKPAPAPTSVPDSPNTPITGEISCSTVVDIGSASNILFKNENIHGGRGRTWLDQDHQAGGVRKLVVAGLNGKVFSCFGLYRCDRPYGCRYYQAMCGDPLGNSQFLAASRANSSGQPYAVVTSGNGKCYKFRTDVARYGGVRK